MNSAKDIHSMIVSASNAKVAAEYSVEECRIACYDREHGHGFSQDQIDSARLELDDALTAYYRARAHYADTQAVFAVLVFFCDAC